ncbi:T9SS type A sorting domain-containing protein [Flavobacterium selenitireducens]|uniref:T9SS type A sorting domain-containing protein n=1 Tax=Flavobacterium selenitireducens TaxID=2722704 RepID=UPI00168B9CC1|nr:T9SS type A sorting domain-containing protein [Flavobacterium selenitireducens]MBD3581889.1 T9SS type A sorting domain-containing protein [Flavobacterium selenitireducens]
MKKITFLLLSAVLLSYGSSYAQPTTNAPIPTNAAGDVISIYSDSFTSVATNFDPNWNQSGFGQVNSTFDPGTGNLVLAYPNFNYQGTELATQNASGMEFLHVDVWTSTATNLKVSPINNGTGVAEILVDVPVVQGQWSSVNIPKSAFTGMTWDAVFQIKFDGTGGTTPSTIYLDNIYFWKTATPAGADASLSNLQVNGATVPGFSASVTNYLYELVVGTTVIPQITSATATDSNATITSITQATTLPGTAMVLVTSQDGTVTKSYTVTFVPSLPNPSPTPGTPNAQVLNIYSDTGGYTNNWTPNYAFGTFSGKPDLDLSAEGVNEAIKMNFAVAGYGEGTTLVTNISNYQWLHFDYFADSNSNEIRFIVIGNNNGAVNEYVYELTPNGSNGTLVQGSWQSVNVPLSFFEGIGFNKANFFQFKLGTTSDLVSDIVYFDNIYFSVVEPFLKTDRFGQTAFNAYPNPAQNEWNVTATQTITSIRLSDVTGKQIRTLQPNDTNVVIDASDLSNGIYFANIVTENGSKTVKLVKN